MRLFLLIIVLICFAQTTFLPINLCLVFLVSRALVTEDTANYASACTGGILLGVLTSLNIGFWALFFLVSVKLISFIRLLPLFSHWMLVVPVTFGCSLIASSLLQQFFGQTIQMSHIYIEAILSLPVYICMRYWYEHISFRTEMKLKIRGR